MAYRAFLRTRRAREYAKMLAEELPDTYFATFREAKRSDKQNAKMWAMLGDVADAEPDGRKATPEVWKCLFMHALGHETRFEMGLDGRPFPVGFRSSKLTVKEMSDLIAFIGEYGDRHGVVWTDPQERAA